MADSTLGGRPRWVLGIWVVCALMVLAISPFWARTTAALANPGGPGIQRAQVEIDDDEDEEDEDEDEEDQDDQEDEDDDRGSEPGRYESPSFGYVLEYDPDVWEVNDELTDEFGDWLQLFNGPSFVSFSGTDEYDGDPGDCLDAWEESLAGGDGVEDFEPLEDDDGDPIADEDDESAHAAWVFSSDDGDEVFDVTCLVLIEDEATLTVILETFENQYDDQIDELDELLEGLDLSDVESGVGGRQEDDDDDRAGGDSEVITDDFEDEDDGVFSTESAEPDLVEYRYDDGEYVIETLDPDAGTWQVQLNGPYADVVVAVDARIEGRTAGRFVKIGCRFDRSSDGFQEYSLVLDPDAQRVLLYRSDGDDIEILADEDDFDAVNPDDESNRIELSCIGEMISASVNGEEFAEIDDDSHAEGAVYLGAGTYADVSGTVEARFDNLEVTILGDEEDEADEDDRDQDEDDRDRDEDDDVIVEDFDDEDDGLIRASENDLARYSYDDGEFVVEWLPDDGFGSAVISFFPSAGGAVADVTVAVDARLVGESADRAVLIGCREGAGPDGETGAYRLMVEPDARAVTLFRVEAAEEIEMARETRVGAVERGDGVNRVELSCVGETIDASVNGEIVISIEDDTLEEGAISLGVEIGSEEPGPAEVRWDNMEVRIAA